MTLDLKKRKTLYVIFVSSIVLLLFFSQALVQYQINHIKSDGELINDAGRMRMLSQRIVQQSLRSNNNHMMQHELCETLDSFKEHIVSVNTEIDPELYLRETETFDSAKYLSLEIVNTSTAFCLGENQKFESAYTRLFELEKKFIPAQNKAVLLIQENYEDKVQKLSTAEIILAAVTIIIVILEVVLIFMPLDKANSDKRKELKKLLQRQREISRTVAHDLRSPIGAISSIYNLLKDELIFKDHETKELFNSIGLAAENATATASSMLVMDEGNSLVHTEQKEIQLYALVKAQVNIISSNDLFKSRLIVQNACDSCKIKVNIHEISRMIQNLIDNALKYSKEGVLVEVSRNNTHALFTVKDTGIGLKPETIQWILNKDAEQALKHSDAGFGLGMQFVKQTVAKHNGYINIKSPKKGTTFIVYLPLVNTP